MEAKYCEWFNQGELEEDNVYYFFISCCGEVEKVKKYSKRCKDLYKDGYYPICPHCKRPITIGCEMD